MSPLPGTGPALAQGSIEERLIWTGSARLRYGDIAVMGEYLAALDNFQTGELAFDGRGAEPSAWMLEAA